MSMIPNLPDPNLLPKDWTELRSRSALIAQTLTKDLRDKEFHYHVVNIAITKRDDMNVPPWKKYIVTFSMGPDFDPQVDFNCVVRDMKECLGVTNCDLMLSSETDMDWVVVVSWQ